MAVLQMVCVCKILFDCQMMAASYAAYMQPTMPYGYPPPPPPPPFMSAAQMKYTSAYPTSRGVAGSAAPVFADRYSVSICSTNLVMYVYTYHAALHSLNT